MLIELARVLSREAKEWARIKTGPMQEPFLVMTGGVPLPGSDQGVESYLSSFRLTYWEPERGEVREFTVTITESRHG